MKIAVFGGGPIGIEFAAAALENNFDVVLYEKGNIGESVSRWSHVQLFSDWPMNVSPWGGNRINFDAKAGVYPTGGEFIAEYIKPLADSLGNIIQVETEVLGVTRKHSIKNQFVGSRKENAGEFRILLRKNGRDFYEDADFIVDASGVYENPAGMGIGGLPAANEHRYEAHIERYEVNSHTDKNRYAGKRILVIGGGYSAITSVQELLRLKRETPSTLISWAVLQDPPFLIIEDDALPDRKRIATLGNDLISKNKDGVAPLVGFGISELHDSEDGAIRVILESEDEQIEIIVDEIVSNVGYRPDLTILRELHFHLCYASEGPMGLAASLLAAGGDGLDCLTQVSPGIDTLRNPEPNLFVLGAKSYGRNSAFLLTLGHDQIKTVIDSIT